MADDPKLLIETSAPDAFIRAYRKVWLAEELEHRPLLRLSANSMATRHCLTVYAETKPIGFACLTQDDQIILSPLPKKAIPLLAEHLVQRGLHVPGIFAPQHAGLALADALGGLSGVRYRLAKRILHWEMASPVDPLEVEGRLRCATRGDRDALVEMYFAMQAEMNTQRPFDADAMVGTAIASKTLFVWEVRNGEIVCAGKVDLGDAGSKYGEVGNIYSVPAFRGRGIASALVGCLANEILKQKSVVFLSSDAADAPSSKLYKKIGFNVEVEMVNLRQLES
ncbi:hypothetical protein MXMO3_03182 [Maritalea myrionectae]|uniref:N-acetyltransferase domain-containing protein n=1 Tax=Maritalea myrionectae TaxID=454601 RepID=A0A2R4MI23_9HYPH|nr:GNAT family N-acetyltransferase [Maritalea myrionectae]AVX05688.1 hypothetical protein MXMO3_03182 [Maritalea myrionectae]